MYALYRKTRNGYSIDVKVLAVSENKEVLMSMLPFEVFKWIKETTTRTTDEEIYHYWLNDSMKPRDYWGRGAFDENCFEVVEVNKVI